MKKYKTGELNTFTFSLLNSKVKKHCNCMSEIFFIAYNNTGTPGDWQEWGKEIEE